MTLTNGTGKATLRTVSGQRMTLQRAGSHVELKISAPGTELETRTLTADLSTSDPMDTVQVTSPGTDPSQLLVLLKASTLPGTVVSARPVTVTEGTATRTFYTLTIDNVALAAKIGTSDSSWLSVMGRQRPGRYIDLRVDIRDKRIISLFTDLPVTSAPSRSPPQRPPRMAQGRPWSTPSRRLR